MIGIILVVIIAVVIGVLSGEAIETTIYVISGLAMNMVFE